MTGPRFIRASSRDLVLMDISMPGGGVDATGIIRSQWPMAKIICMSVMDNGQFARALCVGASACLLKDAPWAEMLEAIHAVYNACISAEV